MYALLSNKRLAPQVALNAALRATLCVILSAWLLWASLPTAHAQDAQAQAELSLSIHQLVDQDVHAQAMQDLTRVEVELGQLDPRIRLTPCERMEPFIPPGQRLWGSARVGIRCVQGQRPWQVFLPVTVRVYGNALVAASHLPAGQLISESDLAWQEVDWAASPAGVYTDPAQLVGRTSIRALQPGEPFRVNLVRAPQLFAAGATVKLMVSGSGFAISAQGRAMNHGLEGETVRVRLDNGRVVQGRVVDDGTVELRI